MCRSGRYVDRPRRDLMPREIARVHARPTNLLADANLHPPCLLRRTGELHRPGTNPANRVRSNPLRRIAYPPLRLAHSLQSLRGVNCRTGGRTPAMQTLYVEGSGRVHGMPERGHERLRSRHRRREDAETAVRCSCCARATRRRCHRSGAEAPEVSASQGMISKEAKT